MRHRAAVVVLLAAFVSVAHSAAAAQNDDLTIDSVNDDDYPFVEVTITVPEALEGVQLPKEAFAVSENGGPPQRPLLGNRPDEPETTPPRAVLAIDVSGSMDGNPIDRARDAADAFVQSLPSDSEVAVVAFGDAVEVVLPFTSDLGQARSSIQGIVVDPAAETALYDGVREAADLLAAGDDARTSIILLSDGGDTVSDTKEREAINYLRDRDATLWAVGLQGSDFDPAALEALAGETGQVFTAENADNLDEIYRGLASDLSRRYVLRFESESTGDTEIGVLVEYLQVDARTSIIEEIDGTRAAAPDRAPSVATPDVFTVRPGLLGTTTAYTAGLVAVTVGSLVIWLMLLGPRSSRTRERLMYDAAGNRSRPRLSVLAAWTTDLAERSLRNRTLGQRLDRYLEGAGLDLRPGEVTVIIVSAMVVSYALGAVLGGVLLGVLLATMPPLVTRLVLSVRRDRRQTAFSEQLTDILQLISGSLRAGHGLLQGIDAVARDAEEPAASEFRRILIEHRLGRDLSTAMQSCAERMDNADFSWVVQAIGIHRDVGGDLSRVLDNVITTIRDRGDVHRQVRALSAEGRLSAWVLTGLPFVVLIGVRVLNPAYLSELFARPAGWIMLAIAALLMLIGTLWIRTIMRVRY
jgi:tight adherence protein B